MIREANQEVLNRLKSASPRLVDIRPAKDVIEGMDKYTVLHAGPPIDYPDMCAPMKEAVNAALIYEGLAANRDEAISVALSGKVKYYTCHEKGAVGPMTGVTTYSMPLLVVENTTHGNFAYSTINEGAGDVIRFGACTERTIERLHWIEDELAPCLKKALEYMGGLDLSAIMSQGLSMGDELHMRNMATSVVLLQKIVHPLSMVCTEEQMQRIMKFLTTKNDQFFLNMTMAANKSAADAADGVHGSTVVSAIARNGVEVGIRISGLPGQWFTAPAPLVDGLYFSGYSKEDANGDIGDSAIMETNGFGGFAMAAAPAIVRLLGIPDTQMAFDLTESMRTITVGEHQKYTIPGQNFRGLPLGIDIMKVVETTVTPGINTAIVSKEPGVGMIGAGLSRVPFECFKKALIAFDKAMQEEEAEKAAAKATKEGNA